MSASTPSKITASLVSVWSDGGLVGAALTEREDSSGWNLVFERTNVFTDADHKAGTDTYCITNEAGVAVYGGVSSWSIAGTELSLSLADSAAGDLGVATELTINLAISPAQIKELGTSLTEILK
jgi:hypothetical protein